VIEKKRGAHEVIRHVAEISVEVDDDAFRLLSGSEKETPDPLAVLRRKKDLLVGKVQPMRLNVENVVGIVKEGVRVAGGEQKSGTDDRREAPRPTPEL
jgi:hypothetical protein